MGMVKAEALAVEIEEGFGVQREEGCGVERAAEMGEERKEASMELTGEKVAQ